MLLVSNSISLETFRNLVLMVISAHYGDEVYDLLSAAFDDPSATIVYPYVYRILNSSSRPDANRNGGFRGQGTNSVSPASSRPTSPQETVSSANSVGHRRSPTHRTSPSSSSTNGNPVVSPVVEEPDPDAQLLAIIGHISSETTGALHKEGITELHHFLKQYPHKKPRVDKLLESTGTAFRKYIGRALASRATEDAERETVVADTLMSLFLHSFGGAHLTSAQNWSQTTTAYRQIKLSSESAQKFLLNKTSYLDFTTFSNIDRALSALPRRKVGQFGLLPADVRAASSYLLSLGCLHWMCTI